MKEETFEYSYSAKQQDEVEAIRRKYLPKEEDKLEQLRRLDAGVNKKAMLISVEVGVVGTLIFGGGMSLSLVGTDSMLIPGIILGLLGFAVMGAALPLYHLVMKKEREKIAPQILALAEELRRDNNAV